MPSVIGGSGLMGRPSIVGRLTRSRGYGADPWANPGFTRAPISDHTQVIIVGGGFGGLLAGARLREAGIADIRVIEGGGDFGGTWYANRYPGAMCDIEAHIYMPLLEEMGYSPKHRYAYADELFAFSQAIGRRYGLYDKACFQTRVTGAAWVREENRWLITTDRGDGLTCDYLVLAIGRQRLPKLPNIPGIGGFTGHVFHSSRWDYDYTKGDLNGNLTGLSDKRVAIVGTGATAVQIVPAVAKWAKQLLVFQRTPSAVGPRGNRETPPDWVDSSVPGWQKRRRENFQQVILGRKQHADEVSDGWTSYTRMVEAWAADELEAALGRPPMSRELDYAARVSDFRLMNHIRARTEGLVTDPATAEALKPWYRWRCKRPCWHDEYLASFNQPNVTLIDTGGQGVERFTARGAVVGVREHEVDCVIFATGFDVAISYTQLLGFDPVGRTGTSLSEHWSQGTRTWFGMMTDEFPNCFFVGANQQTGAAVNAVHLLDELSVHVAHVIGTLAQRDAALVEPSAESVDAWVRTIRTSDANQKLLEFFSECTPGYFNAEGRAQRSEDVFAGDRCADPIAYFQMLKAWRLEGSLDGLVVKPTVPALTMPANVA